MLLPNKDTPNTTLSFSPVWFQWKPNRYGFLNRFNCLFIGGSSYLLFSSLLFVADGHESRISDTEDLLGNRFGDKESVDRSRASSTTPLIDSQNFNGFDPSTLPPSQPQSPQQNSTPKQHLNLEVLKIIINTSRNAIHPKQVRLKAYNRLNFFYVSNNVFRLFRQDVTKPTWVYFAFHSFPLFNWLFY